jgi:hypothetical protein
LLQIARFIILGVLLVVQCWVGAQIIQTQLVELGHTFIYYCRLFMSKHIFFLAAGDRHIAAWRYAVLINASFSLWGVDLLCPAHCIRV